MSTQIALTDILRTQLATLNPADRMTELRKRRAAALSRAVELQHEVDALDDSAAEAAARAAMTGIDPVIVADRRPALRDAIAAALVLEKVCNLLAEELAPGEIIRLVDLARAELEAIKVSAHTRQRDLLVKLTQIFQHSSIPATHVIERVLIAMAALEPLEIERKAAVALRERIGSEACELFGEVERRTSLLPMFHRPSMPSDAVPSLPRYFQQSFAIPEALARQSIREAINTHPRN